MINGLNYSLDQNSGVGFFVEQVSRNINKNNVEKLEQTFYWSAYVYAFECYFCDSFLVVSTLGTGSTDYVTIAGSHYYYTGWGITIYGGHQWYYENNVSLVVGLGPSYQSSSKQSESEVLGYADEVEVYVKNMSFQPISPIPLMLVGYTF